MFSVSILIPAYNEEQSIENALIENIKILNISHYDYEIIIVDDGSTDRTLAIIQKGFSNNPRIKVFSKINGGFGSAIKYGIKKCSKDYVLCIPVDSPLTKEVFDQFNQHFNKGDVLVAFRKKRLGYTWRMKLNSSLFHFLVTNLFHIKLNDFNWIHAYRRTIFDKINIEYSGIFMLAEVLIKAKRNNLSIIEFPVDMIKRSGGVATAGSWRAALKTLGDLLHFYFSRR